MNIFPAIDLRQGQCVRLLRGDPNAQTIYADNPAAMAANFAAAGAEWLHVVNLDGALGDRAGAAKNLAALQQILTAVSLPVQVGGGIRTADDVARLLDLGVQRVIIGTLAVKNRPLLAQLLQQFGADRIIVGLDAKEGLVATHGWQSVTAVSATELGCKMAEMGLHTTIYTDISRDGTLAGANVAASAALAQATRLQVIVSGGVASLADVAAATAAAGIAGIIIGRALYTGDVDLKAAVSRSKQLSK